MWIERQAANSLIELGQYRLLSGLAKWMQVSGKTADQNFLVYAGAQEMALEQGKLLPWDVALWSL